MDTYNLPVQPRETGKRAAKATRAADRVPCVLYGVHTTPVHFSVETLALRPLIHTSETYRVAFSLDGADHEAIVKQITFHPVTDKPIHVDFQALTRGETLDVTVQVQLEGTAPGVLAGGSVSHAIHEVLVRAMPRNIPGHLSVDISALEIGDSVTVADLALSEGVEMLTDGDLTIVSVQGQKADAVLDAEEAAAADEA